MEHMRRVAALALALGYGLSFVAACLAACLVGPAMDDHACCAGDGTTMAAASRACCSSTPGIAHGGAMAAAAPLILHQALFGADVQTPEAHRPAATVSPSPPLVLRI